jgi:hypothetical protein
MDEEIRRAGRRIVAHLPARTPLLAAIDALRARHRVEAGMARLSGRVSDVVLHCEGAAAPFSLLGTMTLVSGEALLSSGPASVAAVLAWSDRGLPRMAAGIVDDAQSEGVDVVLEAWEEEAATEPAHPAPAPRVEAAKPAAAPRPAAPAPARPAPPAPARPAPPAPARPAPAPPRAAEPPAPPDSA